MNRSAVFILAMLLSLVVTAQEVPTGADAILKQVLGPNGHLDKALYDQFWSQFKNQPEHDVELADNWMKSSLLMTQEYETELWKCVLLSYDSHRVVKSKRLLLLENEVPTTARKSIPWPPGSTEYNDTLSSYDASVKTAMDNARLVLDAAAHRQPLVTATGRTVMLDKNTIKQASSSVDASFVRLTKLLDRHWNGG